MAGEILRRNIEIDIRSLLPAVSQPTLVVHCTRDPLMPVEFGRYIAAHIPDARLVEIDGEFHASWRSEDQAKVRVPIRAFLDDMQGFVGAGPGERVLATVLFSDIVGSTDRAVDLGDAAWRRLLDRHDTITEEQVTRFGGRVVKTTGDGVLATFDGPSRAVACARALHEATSSIGLPIRAGLHTGEVERRGKDLGGIGVHIAARVAGLAAPGEVLATRTVRDLTVGSGLEFSERGRHQLKGLPDEWELYGLIG